MEKADDVCPPEWVDAEDPLFMLYTRYVNRKSIENILVELIYKLILEILFILLMSLIK